MKKHRLAHLIYQFTPPQHSTIVLHNKLEACKAKLEESYVKSPKVALFLQ